MKDHDVLFHLFFFAQIFSDAPSERSDWDIFMGPLEEPLLGVFLAQISKKWQIFFEKNGELRRKLWKLLHDLSSLRGDTYFVRDTPLDFQQLVTCCETVLGERYQKHTETFKTV